MASQLETVGGLERRLTLTISPDDVASKVQNRLRTIARTARMPGFRPGKVPMKMIEQSYGPQVQNEEFGNAVESAFGSAVEEHKLRVAGPPRIEPAGEDGKVEAGAPATLHATFEVYPDVVVGSPADVEVRRFQTDVSDAEVDRTIDILRKQRTQFDKVDRAAEDGDRVTLDFKGTLDGTAFDGGSAEDFAFVLGEGRMLGDFETGARGLKAGESKTIDVAFPQDYGNQTLAGKTAQFELKVKSVEAARLPEVDSEFVRQMGVEDGDVERFRKDVRENIEREVKQRVQARTKGDVMDRLLELADMDVPKALVEQETQAMSERMKNDLQSRGVDVAKLPVPPDAFTEQATRRVKLGLIVSEIVRANQLTAKPDQIRKQIEEFAQAYDNPSEVIRWYFSDRQRLAEVEALVIEQNVVDWMLANAKTRDEKLTFEELMAGPAQPAGGAAEPSSDGSDAGGDDNAAKEQGSNA